MMNGFSPAWSFGVRSRHARAADARVQLSLGRPACYAVVCACGTDTRCKTREHYMIAIWTRLPSRVTAARSWHRCG